MLLHKIEPSYSIEARAAKVQGTVILSVVIGTDGAASDVQLRKGVGYGLDEQAVNAIAQWTFKPGTRDGMAVPVQASIEVNFRLL
jgi:TonB family protein